MPKPPYKIDPITGEGSKNVFEYEQYKIFKDFSLGGGSFGEVFKGYDSQKRRSIAAKEIIRASAEFSQSEVDILRNLTDHDNIVKFYDTFMYNGNRFIIMQLCDGHCLDDFLPEKNPAFDIRVEIISQLIETFQFIHYNTPPTAHRDLKPGNIIIVHGSHVKLCDFGLAKFMDIEKTWNATMDGGSGAYMSPEMHTLRRYNPFKGDVFAAGLVFLTIITYVVGERIGHLFREEGWIGCLMLQDPDVLQRKLDGLDYACEQTMALISLIARMVKFKPEERPDFNEIFEIFTKSFVQGKAAEESRSDTAERDGAPTDLTQRVPQGGVAPSESSKRTDEKPEKAAEESRSDTGFRGDAPTDPTPSIPQGGARPKEKTKRTAKKPGIGAESRSKPGPSSDQKPGTSSDQKPGSSGDQKPGTSSDQKPGPSGDQRNVATVNMASSPDTMEASQAIIGPGLLLTHDWTHLHTGQALVDTTVVTASSPRLLTETFPITNASQYQAFLSGRFLGSVENLSGCPAQLVPEAPEVPPCNVGPQKAVNAIAKVTYQVTHDVTETEGIVLGDPAIHALRSIEMKISDQKDTIPEADVQGFLKTFGSHYAEGQIQGRHFSWMVMVAKECDIRLLEEIAKELFAICEEHERFFPGTHEGVWYNPSELINTCGWAAEKRELLMCARLRVSHSGSTAKEWTLRQWRDTQEACFQPMVKITSTKSTISAWDLIKMSWKQFKSFKKLSTVVKDCWERLVETTQHPELVTSFDLLPVEIPGLGNPWAREVKELGLLEYFPGKLTLQKVRSLHITKAGVPRKKELPWRVLEQMMLMNMKRCEQVISVFARNVKKMNQQRKKQAKSRGKTQNSLPALPIETVPHPMDMVLLVFTCSDFMLRQVLARKLQMCRLAIPFIVPTPENGVEVLMWPLRSIILEWRTESEGMEEALVNCNINMVAFMRSGQLQFSKSKLINDLLGGHDVFFHKDKPCGTEKRSLSNGVIEMTHFLPAGKPNDKFTKPAGEPKDDNFTKPSLFFNLRGNACDFPVQEDLLLDLATVVVSLVDIGELHKSLVQKHLKQTVNREQRVIFILTDDGRHSEIEIEMLYDQFLEVVDNAIDESNIVTTFEMDGSVKNRSEVEHELTEIIDANMDANPQHSLESYVMRKTSALGASGSALQCCTVDEVRNTQCSNGEKIALDLLLDMEKIDVCERKSKLLPQQGDCLLEIGKLLRKLHRSTTRDADMFDKEAIKQEIKQIRQRQASMSADDRFTMKVISIFHNEAATKEFAIKWLQLKLDSISRAHLPRLQQEKNKKWDELAAARNADIAQLGLVRQLEAQVIMAEKKIAAATCGWEHLMREMGQLYEVSLEMRQVERNASMTPGLPGILTRQLVEGQAIELMVGDHGFLPEKWVKAVFTSLANLIGHDKKIFVLSVIGIQSSGKSTLLNTMFGLEFAVSAGRCTRGIYAQLLPTTHRADLPFDYMLVLDSEGLRAHELSEQNYEHDNELATLVIGLADLALINIKGENTTEMTSVLQIVVHAFLRMKLADSSHKRKCMFVHQNVSAVNVEEKLAVDRQKLQEQLDTMTKEASVAQGLAEAITSFNRIISFNSHRDVLYFPDLWHGTPPMATVKQGYSMQASDTQQRILTEISQSFSQCITVQDFIVRVSDMWKGVLSDDFIFSFRSTLAAKAYIEVEREIARLSLQTEQEIHKWMNPHCKNPIANCKSESDLNRLCDSLKVDLKAKLTELVANDLRILEEFFDNHIASEIIFQWKSEKMSAFKMFGQALERRTETDLENFKVCKMFELRQKSSSPNHEQEIIKRAIAYADEARGKHPTNEELEALFDELWTKWLAEMAPRSTETLCDLRSEFVSITSSKMQSEGQWQAYKDQLEASPIQYNESMQHMKICELTKDHIVVKEKPGVFSRRHPSRTEHLEAALDKANIMFKAVLQEIDHSCNSDCMFHQMHCRQIIEFALKEVDNHNQLPSKQSAFSYTPLFRALFVIHAVSCATPRFEKMNQLYEAKHGIKAQMEAYRGRVFLLFKNTIKETSAEVTASEDFCETIKAKLKEYIKMDIEQNVLKHLYQAVGNTKYDLITKMLDEIAQKESFVDLYKYVHKPLEYAESWLERYGGARIFSRRDGQTVYGEFAERRADSVFGTVVASAKAATRSVTSLPAAEQYSAWIAAFCDNMKETVPLDPAQLSLSTTCTIKSFTNFQNFLETQLQMLKRNMVEEFHQVTKETVAWLDSTSPFLKVRKRLWGCTELCPFCSEPCQDSSPNHKGFHRCVQHRPSGFTGKNDSESKKLSVETCSLKVTTRNTFRCDLIQKQCRSTKHCTAKGEDLVDHPYREYKTYLPGWDIAPDPSGEASKFWQWAMCTFRDNLLAMYQDTKLDIPESWKETTKKDAIDSLRVFQV